ncbi:MAG: ATP-binding domain-containing protein [Polyangiaceae bacterium]
MAEEEAALCDKVVSHLRQFRPSQPPKSTGDDDALIDLRDQIASARLEDVPALITQMQQVAAVASSRTTKPVEPVDPESPYFGHLRLEEDERGVRDVLIGRTTHIDPKAGIRIVDWRHAPVSQLYYRYDEGADYEEQFGDRDVTGTVLCRRTVTIAGGSLRRVQSPQGVFVRTKDGWRVSSHGAASLSGGEGSAVRAEHMRGVLGALGEVEQREDRHLPEIAALLDPRQFELISKESTGLVVVQGGAGSGKTTIGVHRMAYLAYQSKQRFGPDRMLVVVGTPALRDYIGVLLEALGMGAVRVVTFTSWSRKLRKRMYPHLDALGVEDNTPVEVSRLKTDPRLLALLEAQAKTMRKQGRTGVRDAVWLWADVLTSRDRVRAAFADDERRLTKAQLERALDWCADHCPAVAEWRQDQDAESELEEIEGADGLTEHDDERATLDDEDESLLLRAYQLLRGPLRSNRNKALVYEHMFVDEAQDLAAVDLCVLADVVSERKSITLAGDTAQRLHVDTGFTRWDEVLAALGLAHLAVEPLKIAYRSTKEVLRFATDVLGPLAEDEPIAPRSGAPVEHHEFPSQGAAAAFLAESLRPLLQREPRATVCILARYPEQAEAYYEALTMAEVPHLRLVANYDFSFKSGVEVTDIRQVKGLEYDYVILIDVNASSYPAEDEARYQLHIGATRAAHQLWVVSTGKPSPLIPAWLLDEEPGD